VTNKTDAENLDFVQRAKVGRYSFLIYRSGDREYQLYARQGSEMRVLLKWACGHAPSKQEMIREVTDFVCKMCPGARPAKIRATVGDEIRYTCYAFPAKSRVVVKNSQTAVRELQKLVPSDMVKDESESMVAHLYDQSPVLVAGTSYDDPSAPHYELEWPDGFRGQFDFDFVDSMFESVKVARVAAAQRAKVLEMGSSPMSGGTRKSKPSAKKPALKKKPAAKKKAKKAKSKRGK